MRQGKSRGLPTSAVACLLLLTAGCADSLTLKFAPKESATYRLARENERSVEWEGPAETKPNGFRGGHTGSRIEMTFTQKTQSVDDKGNAVSEITITALKYVARVKDNITVDFDSSRQEDSSSPLGKLIGQSYIIELAPSGRVTKVTGAAKARAAIQGDSQADKAATNLLSDDMIKEMHTISALPPVPKAPVRPGQSWGSIESVSFDLMGAKSYEKIYTLEEIQDSLGAMFRRILGKNRRDHRMATASMAAVPSTAMAKELHKEQVTSAFSQMSDSTEKFTGELELDLTDGKVERWREELAVEWIIVDFNPQDDQQPAALKMAATRLHSIERMD